VGLKGSSRKTRSDWQQNEFGGRNTSGAAPRTQAEIESGVAVEGNEERAAKEEH
jgi:hypothetical protein